MAKDCVRERRKLFWDPNVNVGVVPDSFWDVFLSGQFWAKWPFDLQVKQWGRGLSIRYIALYSSQMEPQETDLRSALSDCWLAMLNLKYLS